MSADNPDDQLRMPEEKLWRQISPSWRQGNFASSQAFGPFPKDQGLLSVSRGMKINAKAAFEHYTGRGFKSVGVVSLTVQECGDHGLNAFDDILPDDDAHAIIDFREYDRKACKKKAKRLKVCAQKRGWGFGPTDIV